MVESIFSAESTDNTLTFYKVANKNVSFDQFIILKLNFNLFEDLKGNVV